VTESEWLASENPARMLRWLTGTPGFGPANATGLLAPPSPPSDRKLRLWACACCRQGWHLLTDPRSRRAVEVAERYADGDATEAERVAAADTANFDAPPTCFTCYVDPADGLDHIARLPAASPALQAALLRDVFGNPWRPVFALCGNNTWRLREGRTVCVCDRCQGWVYPAALDIARRAYDLRDWDALPVLADALEEAGCKDEQVLGHLRGWGRCGTCLGRGASADGFWDCVRCGGSGRIAVGPHVRGCWSLDVILGKG
jgi:hypothetical protein